MPDPNTRLTQILGSGDAADSEALLPLVYDELRRLARSQMAREKVGNTLQPTALVHETFLRIGCPTDLKWSGRRNYFAAAAEAMRRIMVDQARRKKRVKRGGGRSNESLDDQDLAIEVPDVDVVAVDEALQELERVDPRAREIVNLRFFVGLTTSETADALGVSVSTVEREWRFLRVFLQDVLSKGEDLT